MRVQARLIEVLETAIRDPLPVVIESPTLVGSFYLAYATQIKCQIGK